MFAEQIDSFLLRFRFQLIVARLAATSAHQASGTLRFVGSKQSFDLPYTQAQDPGGFFLCQAFCFDALHHF
jgi:hypothetical protein